MRINVLFALLFIACSVASHAQEFWLQPNKIQYKIGDTLKVSFLKGVNFDGHRLTIPKEKVERFELHQLTGGVQDLKPGIVEGSKFNARLPLQSEGTKMVVLQTTGDVMHYNAQDFNVFLHDNGLDDAITRRKDTNSTNQPATENFTCYKKLLIQVGSARDDSYKKTVGWPLEIVPDKNPLALKKGDVVHFKVLFQGNPLFGARVRIWNYYDYLTTTQNIYTQQDGTIEMTISNVGSWLINVVKMVPAKDGSAEWQSYRGSLMFSTR